MSSRPRSTGTHSRQGKFQVWIALLGAAALLLAQAAAAKPLALKSAAALVIDQATGQAVVSKNADKVMPIASLTKLMTALVVVEAKLPMDEMLKVANDDVDRVLYSHSRLPVGTQLTRDQMLQLALMASENRAACALSRHYPGGKPAFLARMNARAKELGMRHSHFADPAGLSEQSVSTASDLAKLITAAHRHALIRHYSTQKDATVRVRGAPLKFVNTNRLVRGSNDWDIALQKTGYTNDAGRCLVMRAHAADRDLVMIFLNSVGKLTPIGDASRVKRMLQGTPKKKPTPAPQPVAYRQAATSATATD